MFLIKPKRRIAKRRSLISISKFMSSKKFYPLTGIYNTNTAHSISGRRIIAGRKNSKKVRAVSINYSFKFLSSVFSIINFAPQSIGQPYVALIKNNMNFNSYVCLGGKMFLGSKLYVNKNFGGRPRADKSLVLNLLECKTGNKIFNFFSKVGLYVYHTRAAGVFSQLLYLSSCLRFAFIKLPSGVKKIISSSFYCMEGRLSNKYHKYEVIGSAGKNRSLGKISRVRGIAKNPNDHPHGGRTNTVCPEKTPWGWVAKKRH